METMSMFASKEELYQARSLRFAKALVWFMDGVKDHDVAAETGLNEDDCNFIIQARKDARLLLEND